MQDEWSDIRLGPPSTQTSHKRGSHLVFLPHALPVLTSYQRLPSAGLVLTEFSSPSHGPTQGVEKHACRMSDGARDINLVVVCRVV